MTPFRAAVVCPKAGHIVAEDALSVASQHSIGLIDIKWATSMRHRADKSPDMCEISQLVRVRSARSARLRLLEQNFLRSECSTQIAVAASCKVYAGKTDWKTS